ncbi:MAG TPA: polysaccharide biosynthesis/export family protein [Caulobacteraceae bacterium]|jgi:polysaccharide export outer membrane protein
MRFDRKRRLLLASALAALATPALAAPWSGRTDRGFENIPFASWSDDEPAYRFYPGDQIDIATPTAPELSRSVTVGPDGRVSMPLVGAVMAADRTVDELQATLTQAYKGQLVRPVVEVSLKQAAPMRVLVGGEVTTPGWVDMGGDLDALRAVMAAGGPKATAKLGDVVIIRRGADGRPMRRVVNLRQALNDPRHADLVPLRRFDIVYVPRSSLAEVGIFLDQVKEALPFTFTYYLGKTF